MSNASYICEDLLTVFEKALQLPPNSEVIDVLARFVCHYNNSNEAFKLSSQIQSIKESVSILCVSFFDTFNTQS